MILTDEQHEAVETLDRMLRHTISHRDIIPLCREDASILSHLINELITENKSAHVQN